jgi:hypothetical protein
VNTIVNECNQVDTVYSLYDALGGLASVLNAFQAADLNTVKLNLQEVSQANPSEANYWLGQVFVMCVWGLAASAALFFPAAGAVFTTSFGVFVSMVASIAGSAVGYNPTQQKSFAIDEMEQEITNTLTGSIVTQSLDLTSFLSDPVKLNICNGLSGSQWDVPTSLPSTLEGPFQAMDRLWMYQQLVPSFLSINMMLPGQIPFEPLYLANNVAYYLNASLTPAQFQTSSFYQDLFQTLGVSLEDFFVGIGGWAAIPRTFSPPA